MLKEDPTIPFIRIQADIVENQNVGSQYVPLLRLISTEIKHAIFKPVQYKEMRYMKEFNSFRLELCDDTGSEVYFSGIVSLTLHIRYVSH